MTASILPFPDRQSCLTCEHYDTWADGAGYCHLFDTDVDIPIAADDCMGFERAGSVL